MIASIATVIAITLMYIGGRDDFWKNRDGLQALINALGSTILVSVALGILWELVGRRSFSREILESARTVADLDQVGLVRIGTSYLQDPDWDQYFSSVRKLDIFMAYGRTWRNNNLDNLRKVARRSGARMRVYLPDPNDQRSIEGLAYRFNMTDQNLREAIIESRDTFISLRVAGGADIKVFYRPGEAVFSCYRFDDKAILTLYSHARERCPVPTFVCKSGGTLYNFVRSEFDAFHSQSASAE